jgi:YafQ family addiction module toxin component
MNVDIREIKEILKKLKKRDATLFKALQKKINQIASLDKESLQHFKNLRGGLKEYKRVHIGSYVLIFKIEEDTIIFTKFLHHDKAYKK